MAKFVCKSCGDVREGRCKPKKCQKCGKSGKDQFEKKQSRQYPVLIHRNNNSGGNHYELNRLEVHKKR